MIEKFQLQRLIDLPIEGVAERLGLTVRRHKARCPFHCDAHPSLTFHVGKNRYRCYVCGAHGRTIDLVMNLLGQSFVEACHWLANEYGILLSEERAAASSYRGFASKGGFNSAGSSAANGGINSTGGMVANGSSALNGSSPTGRPVFNDGFNATGGSATEETSFDVARYQRFFERPQLSPAAERFLFEERHIDPRVVRFCRLNSFSDKSGTHWLQIPYFDPDGRLVGIQNRNLDGTSPRFRFPKGEKCGIYNLPVLRMLKAGEPLFITEGCSDCWAMLSAGHKAIAIPSATLLKEEDLQLLRDGPDGSFEEPLNLHMFPDADAPGERLFLALCDYLPQIVRHQLPAGCKDFGDYWKMHQRSV